MEICNDRNFVPDTRNVIFAANNLYVASKLLKNTHYEISTAILEVANLLMTEIPSEERNDINKAIEEILYD